MIGRARGRAEGLHFLVDPWQQGCLVEQRFGFLKQVTLVCASSTFRHEKKFVGVAIGCADLDFSRKVRSGVLFFVHVDRCHLAVAQVGSLVGVLHPLSDGDFIAATGEHHLAFLAFDDCCAGVLAHWQYPSRSDGRIFEQVESDESVVIAGLRVVKNCPKL